MLTLHLLGPVELRRDGRVLPITVLKSAALLVLLALGGPASRTRVASQLWPELDETLARRNLRRELARLREQGAGDALQVQGDLLSLSPAVVLDTDQFITTWRSQGPEAALAVWRGAPAPELDRVDAAPFVDWLAAERERWCSRWRDALAQAAATAEAAGRSAAALGWAEALLADDPLQERHHGTVVRLLAAQGRREEALARFEQCRTLLQAELGLAPMAETEALVAGLRQRQTASGPPPAAGQPLALSSAAVDLPAQLPFIGRGAEVALLERAWRDGQTLMLVGDAGVGKSRLALDFAASVGAMAHVGCRPGDRERPYAALARALRLLAAADPAGARLTPWVRAELARLLPHLGPAPEPLQDDEQRMRFFEAVAEAWCTWTEGDFDLVVLDDWHLADPASQALLGHIVQRRQEQRAGAREWLLLRPDMGAPALQRLADDLRAQVLTLQPWSDAEVLDLVRRLSGAADPVRFSARLAATTGGNPFFVAETLRHLAEQRWLQLDGDGVWRTPVDDATQDYRELPVPAGVRDAVLGRVQRLGSAPQRVLEAASLASEPFVPGLLAPACALSELETVLAIEQAVQARLLREHPTGGYAFAHDLVQQALETALGPDRRRLVHRRLALGAEAAGAPPAAIARHHEASGDALRAVPHRLAAGDAAQRLHALSEAAVHWQQALDAAPPPDVAAQLHMRLARTSRWLGDADAAAVQVAALHRLAPLLSPEAAHDALSEAAGTLVQVFRAHDAMPLLDALPPAPDPERGARATLRRVEVLRETGRLAEARVLAAPLRTAALLPGREQAELLDAMAQIEIADRRLDAALALLGEATALSAQVGDEAGVVRGRYRRGQLLDQQGDLAGAEAEFRAGLAPCRRLGRRVNTLAMLQGLCDVQCQRGDWAEVVQTVHAARQPPVGPPRGMLAYAFRTALATALHALGERQAARHEAEQALDELFSVPAPHRVQAAGMLPLQALADAGAADALGRLADGLQPLAELAGAPGAQLLAQIEVARQRAIAPAG